jgi:uncharacterized protein (DUF2236 family)
MREMMEGGGIAVTETGRALAREVLHPPLAPLLWPAFRPVRLLSIGLLPPAIREGYGFAWGARDARALARWVAVVRTVRRAVPAPMREWPIARHVAYRTAAG